jgi:hypothetical protein
MLWIFLCQLIYLTYQWQELCPSPLCDRLSLTAKCHTCGHRCCVKGFLFVCCFLQYWGLNSSPPAKDCFLMRVVLSTLNHTNILKGRSWKVKLNKTPWLTTMNANGWCALFFLNYFCSLASYLLTMNVPACFLISIDMLDLATSCRWTVKKMIGLDKNVDSVFFWS